MLRSLLFAGLLCVIPCLAPADSGPQQVLLLGRGDQLYSRAETAHTLWQAIGFYREAQKLAPSSFEVHWRLARAYVWLAELSADKAEKLRFGKLGYAHATWAIRLNPRRVEGHFWAALGIGQQGQGVGIFTALRRGIRGKFIGHLEEALRLSRSYDQGGPDRIYAMYFHSLPWPLKSNKKALAHFQRSLRYAPSSPYTHYYLATVLLDEDRASEARRHLQSCLQLARSVPRGVGTERVKRLCTKRLGELGR